HRGVCRFGENSKFCFDQVAFGGDEQNAHLVPAGGPVFVEDLKIELDRVDVRNVLLGFPAHKLAGLLFLDSLRLDALDDHVTATDGGYDGLGVRVDGFNGSANHIRADMRVHHLTFHDGIIGKRSDRNLDQFWCRLRVIDDGDLDEAGSDVEPYGSLLPAK